MGQKITQHRGQRPSRKFWLPNLKSENFAENFCSSDLNPHGKEFLKACELVGVPEFFRSAQVELREFDLDWKTDLQNQSSSLRNQGSSSQDQESSLRNQGSSSQDQESSLRNQESSRVMSKVEKLLTLARSENLNEANLAMLRVREILARHNLDVNYKKMYFHSNIEISKQKMPLWQKMITHILTEHFFVEVIINRTFDPHTLTRPISIEIIGKKENVVMAEYVFHFLNRCVNDLAKKADSTSRASLSVFRRGVVEGFAEKLKEQELAQDLARARDRAQERDQDAQKQEQEKDGQIGHATRGMRDNPIDPQIGSSNNLETSPVTKALLNFKNDKLFKKYVRQIYPRLRRTHSKATNFDESAYNSGKEKGRRIQLHKPVTASSSHLTTKPKFLIGSV